MKDFARADTDEEKVQTASLNLTSPPEPGGAAGSPLGFVEVYRQLFPFVWRALRAFGVAVPHLDDAAQDVFVVVHRRLEEFRHESTPRTWIFEIAYRTALNYRRRERRKGGLCTLETDAPSPGPDPEARLRSAQAWDFVSRFLEELDEDKRAVFVLTQLEGLSATQVAETLNIPTNTVYTRLHHARGAFRDALAKHSPGGIR
jgi:RNA polymerase sigma-70 factor, ECF subfamily